MTLKTVTAPDWTQAQLDNNIALGNQAELGNFPVGTTLDGIILGSDWNQIQPEIDLRVPYTGATADVDLGANGLEAKRAGINTAIPTDKYLSVVGLDDQPARGSELMTNYNFVGSASPWTLGTATWNAGGGIPYVTTSSSNGSCSQNFTNVQYGIYECTVVYQGSVDLVQFGSVPYAIFENLGVLSTVFDGTYYTRKYYTQCHWGTTSNCFVLFPTGAKVFSVSVKQMVDASLTASISKDGIGRMDIRGGDQYGNIGIGKLSGSGMSNLTLRSLGIGDYTLSQGFKAVDTVAIGDGVFRYIPNPVGSTAVGSNVFASVVINQGNALTGVGADVFKNTRSATYDTGMGYRAGHNLISNSGYNTIGGALSAGGEATPSAAFSSVTIWGANCAPLLSLGSDNTLTGANVASNLEGGRNNTGNGSNSLLYMEPSGSNNTCLGANTGGGFSSRLQDNNILIGNGAKVDNLYFWTPAEISGFWNIGDAFYASGVTGGNGFGVANGGKFCIGASWQYFDLPFRFSVAETTTNIFDFPWFGQIGHDFIQAPFDDYYGAQAPMDSVALWQLEHNEGVARLNLLGKKYDTVAADGTMLVKAGELNLYPDGGKLAVNTKGATEVIHSNGNIVAADESSLGAEKVTNGSFTGSATGWTLGTGWSYAPNQAVKGADGTGTLSQNVSAVVGEYYKITVDVTEMTVPAMSITLGGVIAGYVYRVGIYIFHAKAATTGNLIFTPVGFGYEPDATRVRGKIDNVSVKKITGGDLIACGSLVGSGIKLTQTVTTEMVVSDRTIAVTINGTAYKLLVKA